MEESRLLKYGYFPKELPPPFNTNKLSEQIADLRTKWTSVFRNLSKTEKPKYKETNLCKYNIPKTGYIRRVLHIPNPLCQIQVSETITANWQEIKSKIDISNISYSKPLENPFLKRALTPLSDFRDFTRERILSSADMLFEIKTDISRFYNSIYTHSIPWALHGKPIAKERRNDLNLLGNKLDKIVREGNHGQTMGIPIGPDTSLVISELIHSEIDNIIQKEFPKLKFLRYIDDLYAYCNSLAEAENFIKKYQVLLNQYQLELNEEKTSINQKIFEFENKWTSQLATFNFRHFNPGQNTDLERFASITFDLYRKYPDDSILLYASKILSKLNVHDSSWNLYQAILFKIVMVEPKSMEVIAKIFIKNENKVDKNKFKSILEKIIDENIGKRHDYELSWTLWLMKEFSFKLTKPRADMIVSVGDNLSILILLDLKNKGLVSKLFTTDKIKESFNQEDFLGEKWLLIYEALIKGWVELDDDLISNNKFFSIMKELDISFYDETYTSRPERDEESPNETYTYNSSRFGYGDMPF
jgi:hypothetical protein